MFEILADTSLEESEIYEKIKILLDTDPEALKRREEGLTPLHRAVLRNLPEVVSLLIKKGMSVNILTDNQQTPLHLAASSGFEDMIFLLGYQPECNFDSIDSEGQTALHKAVLHKHPECVKNLLLVSRFKLDTTIHDKAGQTAVDIVDNSEDLKSQQALDQAFAITNKRNRTVLQKAVISNSDEQVKFHLGLGAPINAQDDKGRTALHLAALCNHAQILLILCHQDNIEMNMVDAYGCTALHYSVALINPDCARILVSAKRPIDKGIRNNDQLTAEELMHKISEELSKVIANKQELTADKLSKWILDQKNIKDVKKALAWAPIVQFEKEIFSLFEPVHHSNSQVKEHLAKNYSELSVSIARTNRKTSDGYTTKLIKKLRKTGSFFADNEVTVVPEGKQKSLFTDSGSGNGVLIIDKPVEKAFLNRNPKLAAKIIKNHQTHFALQSTRKEFENLYTKHDHYKVSEFFLSVIGELQYSLAIEQVTFNQNISGLQTSLQDLLIARGLKPLCQAYHMNQLTDDNYAEITTNKNTVLKLKNLTALCSGVPSDKDLMIDLRSVLLDSLGMLDSIEPYDLVAMLLQLHPFFSTVQRMQSHCIVFSIVKEYDFYKFDETKTQQFHQQVDAYLNQCCDEPIRDCINAYRKYCLEFKTKSLHSITEYIQSILIQPRESIVKRIDYVVIQEHDKVEQDIVFIAREFNVIHVKIYQELALEEYRLKCWERTDSKLAASNSLFDKMQHFIMNIIRSYPTMQLQENAIRLFTLVARESLHHQHGADLTTAFVIFCVLNTHSIEKLASYKSLEKNDKTFVAIKKELNELFCFSLNFKIYRNFLALDERMLPSISFIFKDKIALCESGDPGDTVLGKMYKSFILIKKGLQEVSLNYQSDLLDRVSETVVVLEDDIQESKIEPEAEQVESGKLSKSTSKKNISPRNIFRKDPSPRNNNSSEKKPSPRSALSDSDSSSAKSLHEKKTSPRQLMAESEQKLHRASSERKRLPRKSSADKQHEHDASQRRMSLSKKSSQTIGNSSLDIEISTRREVPVKEPALESPGRLSLFNNSPCSLVKLDTDLDSEVRDVKEYQGC